MDEQGGGSGRYQFGVFDFDAKSLELRKHERPVRARPQALKLLRLLIARPHQLITREEIHKELWSSDVFVDFEQGVNHCVKQLRRVLGDDADTPRYVQTLPRLGYRFIAPVEEVAAPDVRERVAATEPQLPPARRHGFSVRWMWVGGSIGVVSLIILVLTRGPSTLDSPSEPTLAVLPFDVRSMPPDMQHLGVSLTDALITRVSTARNVRVRTIAAVLPFEKGPVDLQDVAKTLRVDYVLSGTVERLKQTDRVALVLTRASDGKRTWRGTITARAGDLQYLEQTVADRVMVALDAKPTAAFDRDRTQPPGAYEAYLQGRFFLARFTSQDTLSAVIAFERALADDGTYALAHAGLAMASAQMYIRFGSDADVATWKTRAERHATRALELEDTLAEAHEALAAVARYTEVDWDRAIEQSLEAIRLNPSLDLPHYYVSSALQHIGRLDLVEEQIVAGLEANPMNLAEAFRLRGVTALWSGRFSDARTHLERVRQVAAKPVSDPHLAQALYYGGDAKSAEAMLVELRGSAQAEQRAGALLASFLAARGEPQQALALVEKVLDRRYRDHHVAYSLGATYAGLGEAATALQWLRESARTGFLCHPWYVQDPLLAPLRQQPEFQSFVARVKDDGDRIAATFLRNRTSH